MKDLRKYCLRVDSYLMRMAVSSCESGEYDEALKYLSSDTQLKYYFTWVFSDCKIEGMLQSISSHVHKRELAVSDDRIIFYDASAKDNMILSQQYLRAVAATGKKVLFVADTDLRAKASKDILSEARNYPNVEVKQMPAFGNLMEKAQYVYDTVVEFAPTKLLMQLRPNSVAEVVAFYALPTDITRYQINHTDHAYMVGHSCLDFSFAFRPYGIATSKLWRGISEDKTILLPYYPIAKKKQQFEGFPEACKGKTVIFSGGTYYKTYSSDNKFQQLVVRILDENPDAVFVYAGAGDLSVFNYLLHNPKYENRFILLGLRHDINEVFKHSDVYIDTYPIGGGLMCQYAAMNGVPLVSLSQPTDDAMTMEGIVCEKRYERITFFDDESFMDEVNHLIRDKEYRDAKGIAFSQCILTEDEFNKLFVDSIADNSSHIEGRPVYEDSFTNAFSPLIMSSPDDICAFVVKTLGVKSVYVSPYCFWRFVKSLFSVNGLQRIKRVSKKLFP